jgi:hypothetical protein
MLYGIDEILQKSVMQAHRKYVLQAISNVENRFAGRFIYGQWK